MEKQTFGDTLAKLRKEQGMTQLELAEKMGVTDKAVSKWERNLSFPDISSISRLSEIFHVTVDDLLQQKTAAIQKKDKKLFEMLPLICKAVAVAMGIAVVVLSSLNEIESDAAIRMLGIGVACLGVSLLTKTEDGI